MAKLKEMDDVDVQSVQLPLHPKTPSVGLTLKELFAGPKFNSGCQLMPA